MNDGPKKLRNWSRNWRKTVVGHHQPETEEQVVELVQQALSRGQRLKVIGSLHSFSEIAKPEEVAVSLCHLNKFVDIDPISNLVTVQAGMRLKDLNAILEQHEMALPIQGSISEQTVAGAISTGTHGSSLSHGNLASLVHGLRLVNGLGELLSFPGDLLPAARVSLGALGIITEVTLACVPAFQLLEKTESLTLGEAIDRLPTLAEESEFIKLWWLPHTNQVQVFRADQTLEERTVRDWQRWVDEKIINRWLFPLLLSVGGHFPKLTPAINGAVAALYFRPSQQVGKSYEIFNVPMPPRHSETEYALDIADAGLALHELRRMIEREDLKIDFVVEVRFVKGDDAWMSPAFGRDSVQIGAYVSAEHSRDRYFEAFAELMKSFGGRPHWGKSFNLTPEELLDRYPMAELFKAQVVEHDPQGIFTNSCLREALGL